MIEEGCLDYTRRGKVKTAEVVYEAGMALTKIRDQKYHHNVLGFETFEAYCKSKWDFASNYTRRLIASARTVENIKSVPMGTIPQTDHLSDFDSPIYNIWKQKKEKWGENGERMATGRKRKGPSEFLNNQQALDFSLVPEVGIEPT